MSAELAGEHPVTGFCARLAIDLDQLSETPLWSLGAVELGADLAELTRLRDRLTELELRLVAEAEHTGAGDNGDDPRAWWQQQTKSTRATTCRAAKLAAALDGPRAATRTALASGAVLVEQAEVIVHAVGQLPDDLDTGLIARAEAYLIQAAAEHDARELRILGRKVLEVIAPVVAEDHERNLLEAQEAEASRRCSFTMTDDGHGSCHGRFRIPTLQGEMLRKALTALASPHRRGEDTGESAQRVAAPLRMGQALCEYLERYPVEQIPHAGGVAATVVLTVDFDRLRDRLGSAHLDTGTLISASEARRIACGAGILPAVLGSNSQVLDLGRKRRLHTEPQRIALAIRDGGCTAEGCDWPPGLCHAHHDHPWSTGGATSLANGRLLCPRHHRQVHDPAYETRAASGNKLTFHRRT